MQELLITYLCVVIALLVSSTCIDAEEGIDLKHILIACFGWPLFMPLIAWKAWVSRSP
jgi:hypothetical protein